MYNYTEWCWRSHDPVGWDRHLPDEGTNSDDDDDQEDGDSGEELPNDSDHSSDDSDDESNDNDDDIDDSDENDDSDDGDEEGSQDDKDDGRCDVTPHRLHGYIDVQSMSWIAISGEFIIVDPLKWTRHVSEIGISLRAGKKAVLLRKINLANQQQRLEVRWKLCDLLAVNPTNSKTIEMQFCNVSMLLQSSGSKDVELSTSSLESTTTVSIVFTENRSREFVSGLCYALDIEFQGILRRPVKVQLNRQEVRSLLPAPSRQWCTADTISVSPEALEPKIQLVKELDKQADLSVESRRLESHGDLFEGCCTGCRHRVTMGDEGHTITIDGFDHSDCTNASKNPVVDVVSCLGAITRATSIDSDVYSPSTTPTVTATSAESATETRNIDSTAYSPSTAPTTTDTAAQSAADTITIDSSTCSTSITPAAAVAAAADTTNVPSTSDTVQWGCECCQIPAFVVPGVEFCNGDRVRCRKGMCVGYHLATIQSPCEYPRKSLRSMSGFHRVSKYHVVFPDGKHMNVRSRDIRPM